MNTMQQRLLWLLPLWSSIGPRLVISSIFLRLQDQAAPLSTSQIHSLVSKSQKSSGELVTSFTALTFSKHASLTEKKDIYLSKVNSRDDVIQPKPRSFYLLLKNNILIKLDKYVEKSLCTFLWLLVSVTTWSFLKNRLRRRFILWFTVGETTKYTWWIECGNEMHLRSLKLARQIKKIVLVDNKYIFMIIISTEVSKEYLYSHDVVFTHHRRILFQ